MGRIFDNYISEASFDELYDNEDKIKEHWKQIVDNIENAGLEVLKEKQAEIDWHLEDNGVTYNIYDNNEGPSNRRWTFDPIPFVIAEDEWKVITKGLQQRAKLFNLILKDLYSNQELIKNNVIPPEVIFGHKGFSTEVFNFGSKEDFNLYFYAADIARGPDGKMWVVGDKTQAPSGLGYTIENRLTMNVIAKDLYPDIEIKKLSSFIEEFKFSIKNLAGGDNSSAVLLTPGPYNETYFEHAYLSAYLEIDMVQGQDLLAKNGSLWLKSLSGLKKINTLLRRVDDRYCDPLELKNNSRLGVAGLVQAVREDNLNMFNPIGSAITENIGLNPFMEKIAQYFLKEDLILPQIATWWCGQKKELDYVIENLETLIIKRINKTDNNKVYFGKKLSEEQRSELIDKLRKSPHQYAAQEEIEFSTVPYYKNGKVEPRNVVIRTFSLKKDDDYMVMNGGLVKMSSNKENLLVSQSGGISKDLWILGKDEIPLNPRDLLQYTPYVETSIEEITTMKAENLFWLGRYLSRSISTSRLILHVIKKITSFYRYEVAISKESQVILQNALTHMTMTYPGFINPDNKKNLDVFPMVEITSVIKSAQRAGSLASTVTMLSNANVNIRDLLTLESWKLFEKMQKEWNDFINRKNDSTMVVASELEKFLIYMMAYKELVRESIFKEQGLILYEIGYKIEDSLLLISKARSILCVSLEKSVKHDVLEGMLNSMESYNAYRAHYKSALTLKHVVDFLILNPQFPKSLMYIVEKLLEEFSELPKAKETLTTYEKMMLEAQKLLKSVDLLELMEIKEGEGIFVGLDDFLAKLSDLFLECSNAFSNTYFSHNED